MYKCKCWNTERFRETYQVETIVMIDDWENISSYDKQSDLIMVTCEVCWDNTEDGSIMDINWEIIDISQ
jgi:sortase (surface protein transpeptidase)